MNKLKKGVFIFLGTLFLGLGLLGVVLPLLPTTPLLLLTAYFYGRGSKRFYDWFTKTWLYVKYLKDFAENKTMTRRYKWTLLLFVDAMLMFPFFTFPNLYIRLLVVVLIITKHLYFHTQITVIASPKTKLTMPSKNTLS